MNDTMSLLLATTILAVGGLGLFMYKNSDDKESSGDDYNEDSLFNMGSFWGSNENHGQELQKQKEIEKQSAAREDTNYTFLKGLFWLYLSQRFILAIPFSKVYIVHNVIARFVIFNLRCICNFIGITYLSQYGSKRFIGKFSFQIFAF